MGILFSYMLKTLFLLKKKFQKIFQNFFFKKFFFENFFMGPNKVFYVSRSVRRALSISEVRFLLAPRAKDKRQFSTQK